jgi:Mce-associated membrane protein
MAVDAGTAAGELSASDGDVDETPTAEGESTLTALDEVVDYDEALEGDVEPATTGGAPSPLLLALVAGLVAVLSLGALSGWLGYRAHQSQQTKTERELYLQVARQGALNLTTIDYQHADADIQRILDSATGQFHDEFAQRSQPFVDAVKKAQSTSEGTVTEAGLESVAGDEAQAIVAVSVKTSVAGAPEQQPRSWRMRLTVEKSGADVKVANVGFVA